MELQDCSIAVLAGGLATRLRPITSQMPKSLISFNGKPFLEYQLELFKKQGFLNVVLCVGYLGEQIEKYFGNGENFGVHLTYSYDGPTLLGTGGALRQANAYLSDVFLVVYGDSYLDVEYAPVLKYFLDRSVEPSQIGQGLMTVYKNHNQFDKSNIIFVEDEIQMYDKEKYNLKMTYIDWGLGILTKKALLNWKAGQTFDLAQLYQKLLLQKRLLGFEMFKRFYEVGSHEGKKEFQDYINGSI
jgi:N-acetyl-alpha-D-muramate 1-phosphate uridylyltransferase